MHVSGHGLVEWVQRYTCAKLSETILLAGEWVFYKGNLQYIRYFIVILIRYLLCYQVQYFSYQVRQALYQNLQFLITLTHTLSHLNKLSPTWTHSLPSEHTLTHLNTLSPTLTHSLPPDHTLSHLNTPSPTWTHNYMQKRWHPTHTSTPLPGHQLMLARTISQFMHHSRPPKHTIICRSGHTQTTHALHPQATSWCSHAQLTNSCTTLAHLNTRL